MGLARNAVNDADSIGGFTPDDFVPETRTISTTSPLTGGGDLSANLTFSMPAASSLVNGYMGTVHWVMLNTADEFSTPESLVKRDSAGMSQFNYVEAIDGVDCQGYINTYSLAVTGEATAPTEAPGTNNTKVATTAFVHAALSVLTSGASAAYDTFLELQTQMEADDTTAAALATTVSGKLTKASNLSDLTNAVTARDNLGVEIGVDVQAYDVDLAAIAGLTSAANKLPYATGTSTWSMTDLSGYGRTLINLADASALRANVQVPSDPPFTISGVVTTGGKGFRRFDKASTMTGWTIVADGTVTIVIDVKKCDYATYPTTSTIMGGTKPSLTGAAKNTATGLSIAIAAGDLVEYVVDSVTMGTATRVQLFLHMNGAG